MEIQMSSRGNLVNLGNVDFNESIGGREIVGCIFIDGGSL